jgi:AAA domain
MKRNVVEGTLKSRGTTMNEHEERVVSAAPHEQANPRAPGTVQELSAMDFAALGMEELRRASAGQHGWLLQGYLAPGNVTLLTSQWKSGKTTLMSVLLSRMKTGGQFAGLPLRAGRATVVSEESPAHWVARSQHLDLDGGHVRWICRPFRGKPTREEWLGLVDALAAETTARKLDLVVIDPLASFLPGHSENNAGTMLDVLLPLQRLTTLGASVFVLHHPGKGDPLEGQAARGSGALPGYVDILIEMNWFARPMEDDRRRRLVAFSRHRETPRRLVIELGPLGTDYLAYGDFAVEELDQAWDQLQGVLEEAHGKLTRREILKQWPQDYRPPNDATLWRWLERAVADGRVHSEGTGRRSSPFRYWLPEKEKEWADDPSQCLDLPPLDQTTASLKMQEASVAHYLATKGRLPR